MDFLRRLVPNRYLGYENEIIRQEPSNSLVTPAHSSFPNQDQLLRAPRPQNNRQRRRHSDDPSSNAVVPQPLGSQSSNQNLDQRVGFQRLRFFGRDRVARNVIALAGGQGDVGTRSRRRLQYSVSHQLLSSAHPANFAKFYLNDNIAPYKFIALQKWPKLDTDEKQKHAWNPNDRSANIYIKRNDPFTLHRWPIAQSTDAIRGKTGYSSGFHVWQIVWPLNQRGTHAVVGVATKNASLHRNGYMSLLGVDDESYGWDLNSNKCFHDSQNSVGWQYPSKIDSAHFRVPDRFYCILDMDEGYLAFGTRDAYYGVAFRGLKGRTLFPIVSAVWGHAEISLHYVGSFSPQPISLVEACRKTIRIQMCGTSMNTLDLPLRLQRYLMFK